MTILSKSIFYDIIDKTFLFWISHMCKKTKMVWDFFIDDIVDKTFLFWISHMCKKAKMVWDFWLHIPTFALISL